MRRSTDMDENAGTTGAAFQHPEQQASTQHPSPAGDRGQPPSHDFEAARRYLELLGGGDVPHLFQPYNDRDRRDPKTAWMARSIYKRLSDAWPELLGLQRKGAAIAVTMAETNGRGRKSVDMLHQRAVWIEADGPLRRELPLHPSIVVETSPGKRHYVYVVTDLDWGLWHGVQQLLIDEFGSDPQAASKTQVLRLPGTLHQKDPANAHLVRIVEELSSWQVYSAAEIAAAFPPTPTAPPRPTRESGAREPGSDWVPEKILSAFVAIDAHLQERGPFKAQGDRPDDQVIEVDWSLRSFWLRAISAVHHASGGSDAGYELSCRASGGDASKGLVGCPEKFNEADQSRVWDSLSSDDFSEFRAARVTIHTIYWIAGRYCGWNTGRRGRPMAQPRQITEVSPQAKAVADAGRRAVSAGLDRVRQLHADICTPRFRGGVLIGRVMAAIRERLNPRKGVVGISSLAGMADTLGCRPESLRRRIRELAQKGLIVKNEGNATSMLGTSGITVALALPERAWEALERQQTTAIPYPPISDTTGIATPDFQTQAGWNPSRSPYSHGVGGDETSCSQVPTTGQDHGGDSCHPGTQLAALWSKPDLTLGEWIEAGVIHAEFGDHFEDLADKRGKGAISGVLVRLRELRTLRKSFAEIRCDAERAARAAARSLARKAGKLMQLTEADIAHMVERASPETVDSEDSAAFVRAMVRPLNSIIREAKGEPDPWRSERWKRWQAKQGKNDATKPEGNAYAEAQLKRNPSAFS